MSTPVILKPLAQGEYDDAGEWYDAQQPGRGAAFVAAVRQVLTVIENQPDRYPLANDTTREAPVPGYPYCVYYRVHPNQIAVIAVYHNSRDPAGWQSRR